MANMPCYYMGSSVSGQDGLNRALWLATRAGKMEPSCPLGTTRCIPQAKLPRKPYNKSFIDQVCSVKMARYWPRSFFCEFMDLDFVSVPKYPCPIHTKKDLGQYPVILTSHLVKNPYILSSLSWKMAIAHQRARAPRLFFPVIVMTLSQALREKRLIWFLLLKID